MRAVVRSLTGDSGATSRHEAAACRAKVTRMNTEQGTKTRDVLSQRYPADRQRRILNNNLNSTGKINRYTYSTYTYRYNKGSVDLKRTDMLGCINCSLE